MSSEYLASLCALAQAPDPEETILRSLGAEIYTLDNLNYLSDAALMLSYQGRWSLLLSDMIEEYFCDWPSTPPKTNPTALAIHRTIVSIFNQDDTKRLLPPHKPIIAALSKTPLTPQFIGNIYDTWSTSGFVPLRFIADTLIQLDVDATALFSHWPECIHDKVPGEFLRENAEFIAVFEVTHGPNAPHALDRYLKAQHSLPLLSEAINHRPASWFARQSPSFLAKLMSIPGPHTSHVFRHLRLTNLSKKR